MKLLQQQKEGLRQWLRLKYPLLTIFMTGGDCSFVKSIVEFEKNGIFAVENLTMIGLNTILNYNDK